MWNDVVHEVAHIQVGKKKTRLIKCFSFSAFLFATPGIAQELPPPDSLYVATQCYLNDGVTFDDAVEEGRARQIQSGGPNMVFYRQPIAGNNAEMNQLTRVVSWDDMEHWASSVTTVEYETITCNDRNRRFLTNRSVGENRNAYSGSSDRSSLVSTRRCTLAPGTTIADSYRFLSGIQAAREASGDTSTMHLSHLFLGPSEGTEMRTGIIIRLIGESAVGLARTFDSTMEGNVGIGTPANAPARHCQDPTLTRSYIIHSNNE